MLTNRRKAQLIIIVTFLLGTIVGASGQYLLTRQSLTNQPGSPQNIFDEMSRAVRLNANQRTQVEQILNDTRRQNQDLRNQLKPQFTAIRDASRQRIRELLSPEQQALYDKWNQELDAKREQKAKEEAAKGAK
ncbi:MAG: hypothetical protein L0226_12505 [Acidobacteria bacterium]|nr:hypothetical protein [Acidobacteriota bacterium]